MHVFRGMTEGLLAGLTASWVMNRFQAMRPQPRQQYSGGPSASGSRESEARQKRRSSNADEDATVKTAERVSQRVFHHELSDCEKQIAGPAVHYAYGALIGGLYGGLAELLPGVSAGLGMPFGMALWLL